MKHILYNPVSNNGRGKETADLLVKEMTDYALKAVGDISYEDYLSGLPAGDEVILVGGDGTLNVFCNVARGRELPNKFYFYKAGSGNDFFRDLENTGRIDKNMICLNDLIENLPVVTVNGEERVFINGVGFGIDGYCCEEGDKQRAASDKPVNYAGIAVKGLLFKYKPLKATVTVDGVTTTYKKVWLAPTMKGRFYGGGEEERNKGDTAYRYGAAAPKKRLTE